ncbi:Rossmann-like and DUF2520 domain-containing protein [Pedobacter insulae]|uniref:Predicted oxidoreductase, contains short-chain dehydrogenase (SDR) and DUF2520 domains n=1 Tax=Pedobacter insulae TaxID=414048 RepID=A0A1I2VRU2_9SPHI|nr:DUF2520 domain-containing protein [Pedobacter insulae]SFG90196.1 Predicted oxidoreductase, contains short-chain dehydrogenase (SDR) and DUF2520 domains [Pedobacter insulae]
MKVILIGSGNVATHIGLALKDAGVLVTQVWSKQYDHAQALATLVSADAIENLNKLDQTADFCIIAIKDDAILSMAKELTTFKGIIVHTSGAVDLTVFEGFEKYGVFYPLQTFSIAKEIDFSTVPICIEANTGVVLTCIEELAKKLSRYVVEIGSDKRKILHLAAVFACNFTNHLYAISADLLSSHGLDFNLIRPLILETAEKVQLTSPKNVQTGPAVRNDERTMKKHEELLLEQPQLINIYQILSESIKKTKK